MTTAKQIKGLNTETRTMVRGWLADHPAIDAGVTAGRSERSSDGETEIR